MFQPAVPQPGAGLSHFHFVEDARRKTFALRSRSVMLALSHLIEDNAHDAETVLVATFQSLSRYRRQLGRYRALAARLGAVYVIGVPDVEVEPVPNVTIVPIEPDWPLAQEWVVLASGPSLCVGLLARADTPFAPDRPSRSFYGRWTNAPSEVDACLEAFGRSLGQPLPSVRHSPRALFASSQQLLKQLRQRL